MIRARRSIPSNVSTNEQISTGNSSRQSTNVTRPNTRPNTARNQSMGFLTDQEFPSLLTRFGPGTRYKSNTTYNPALNINQMNIRLEDEGWPPLTKTRSEPAEPFTSHNEDPQSSTPEAEPPRRTGGTICKWCRDRAKMYADDSSLIAHNRVYPPKSQCPHPAIIQEERAMTRAATYPIPTINIIPPSAGSSPSPRPTRPALPPHHRGHDLHFSYTPLSSNSLYPAPAPPPQDFLHPSEARYINISTQHQYSNKISHTESLDDQATHQDEEEYYSPPRLPLTVRNPTWPLPDDMDITEAIDLRTRHETAGFLHETADVVRFPDPTSPPISPLSSPPDESEQQWPFPNTSPEEGPLISPISESPQPEIPSYRLPDTYATNAILRIFQFNLGVKPFLRETAHLVEFEGFEEGCTRALWEVEEGVGRVFRGWE